MSIDYNPHPWNQNFAWRPATSTPAALTADQTEQFNRLGFFVMEDLLDSDTIDAVVGEIDAIEAETEDGLRQIEGERLMIAEAGAITFTPHLVARSNLLRQVAADPRIGAVCLDLVGPNVNLYWDQAVYKKPEKPRRFPWHQDNGYTFIEPQQYLTVWLALNDATVDNGCPWVAPGVHLHGTLAHTYVDPLGFECFEQCENPVAAPVPAGGAVVFSSLTPHLTGPNTTDGSARPTSSSTPPPERSCSPAIQPRDRPPVGCPATPPERQYAVTRSGAPVSPCGI